MSFRGFEDFSPPDGEKVLNANSSPSSPEDLRPPCHPSPDSAASAVTVATSSPTVAAATGRYLARMAETLGVEEGLAGRTYDHALRTADREVYASELGERRVSVCTCSFVLNTVHPTDSCMWQACAA